MKEKVVLYRVPRDFRAYDKNIIFGRKQYHILLLLTIDKCGYRIGKILIY